MRPLVLLVLSVVGCSATLVERNYGPPRSGRAQYLNNGADFVIEKRRASADKEIRAFCRDDGNGGDGDYHLDGENENSQLAGAIVNGGMVTALNSNYVQLRFTCDSSSP
jgi:hypothetical protein